MLIFGETGRASTCICRGGLLNHGSLTQDHVDRALSPYSLQLKWIDGQIVRPHESRYVAGFLGCHFVDASIVGCV